MNSISRNILTIGLCMGSTSLLYFLLLLLHIPFIVVLLMVLASYFFMIRWLSKGSIAQVEQTNKYIVGILIAGVTILTNKAYYIATKHGLWDAWYIWNFHAQYLTSIEHWQNMLANKEGAHPDYPMALPSLLAFSTKVFFFIKSWIVNYSIHFLITLLIPVLVFAETYKKSLLFAGLALILFATNDFYITQGVSQLADTMLAFFFLAAIISINNNKEDKRMLIVAGAFIGLCLWTKNEGVILALFFLLFHFKTILKTIHLKPFAIGISVPLVTWIIFKVFYAPTNDMVAVQGTNSYDQILDIERYKMIYESFAVTFKANFRDIRYGIVIYLFLITVRKKWPDKQIVMIVCICITYMLIYVVSPYDLEWHLFTSQSRLMHQMMPAMMYLLANKFSGKSGSNFRLRSFSIPKRPQ